MADRRVTRSRKDGAGNITALCNPAEVWSPRASSLVIEDIEDERHTYYVNEAGWRADVRVVNGPNGKYLRTDADAQSANNLDNLPDC